MHTAKGCTIRIISIVLIVAILCPINVFAMETRASHYLSSYSAYVYPAGWGIVQVWFDVDGTGYMDEIGALEIQLYESKDNETWTWVKTFDFQDYSDMLGYNDHSHVGHVEYNGTIGRYYKAYVCVWAGKNGDGDSRTFWTLVEKATLFAA